MKPYKRIFTESNQRFNEGLSRDVLEAMAYKILDTGTEPEYIFAPDDGYSDPKEQEDWIKQVTGVKKFNYKRDIMDLFNVYNPIWIDSF